MMFRELVLFSIFAAALVQARYSSFDRKPQVEDDFDGYIELMRNAIDSATRTVFDSRANIRQQVDPTSRKLQATLKAESANLLQELHVLIDKAKVSGIDVHVCATNGEQGIAELPMRYNGEILKCQENIVNEEIALVNEGALGIEHSNRELGALLDSYNRCSGLSVIKCRDEITADANQVSTRISLALSEIVKRITFFDSSLQPNLENCGSGKIQFAVSEGRRVINDTVACVESNVLLKNIN